MGGGVGERAEPFIFYRYSMIFHQPRCNDSASNPSLIRACIDDGRDGFGWPFLRTGRWVRTTVTAGRAGGVGEREGGKGKGERERLREARRKGVAGKERLGSRDEAGDKGSALKISRDT